MRLPGAIRAIAGACVAAAPCALAQTALHDNFDCYEPGAPISTLAAWELWPFGEEAYISDERAFSTPNSLHLDQQYADVVHQFRSIDGRITFSLMMYVPGESAGLVAYIVALNQYSGSFGYSSSIQVKVDSNAGVLDHESGGPAALLIFDRWTELHAEIDTGRNRYDLYYNGALWAEGLPWTGGPWGSGFPVLAAIDLYMDQLASGPGMYIDDVLVAHTDAIPPPDCDPQCYADCDANREVDFFDFLCFQNLFAAADPRADCDQDGDLTFFDFLCFQNEFAAGCP